MDHETCPSAPTVAPRPSEVVFNRPVAPGWYRIRLREPSIARAALPGRFVQFLCADEESYDPLLRRPFSVYCVDRDAGTYDVLYTVVGRGTRWMAQLPDPETSPRNEAPVLVDVLGPLGNTFSAPRPGESAWLVGGGVGVAPLYFLAREILTASKPGEAPRITCAIGARNASLLAGIEDLRALPIRTEAATDDGSEGFHGRVTELFRRLVASEDARRVRVYGCGPQGMNESLRALCTELGLACEICLESVMACGFGICFGCVAPIRRTPEGAYENRRICWEGPVFDAALLHPGIEG